MRNGSIPRNWLFPPSLADASKIQQEIASRVRLEDAFDPIQYVGGLDVSHNLNDPEEIIYASAVLLNWPDLKVKEISAASGPQHFPYIPGFLGFREAPSLIEAYQGLSIKPQLLMIDGHGISHPRGLGIASHLGVLLDMPTIGVAKSILVGKPKEPLGPAIGDQVPLVWKGKPIAMLVRTKARCNPLIISAGHRMTLSTAVQFVLDSIKGYKLPEPTRQAHLAANAQRRGEAIQP